MFLNFILIKDVRPYCRVDISNANTESSGKEADYEDGRGGRGK